jgi:NADPH2:quinone reductase
MKVIAINEFGTAGNFFEEQRDIPQPGAEEVLVRIRAGSFNPIDFKIRQGRFGGNLPLVLGHDASGVIVEVGSGVSRLQNRPQMTRCLLRGAPAGWARRRSRFCR